MFKTNLISNQTIIKDMIKDLIKVISIETLQNKKTSFIKIEIKIDNFY